MKKIFYFFIILALGCNNADERKIIIDTAIKEKIDDFIAKKKDEQQKKEMERATAIADSVLLLNADLWQLSMDSLHARPPRVTKPSLPDVTVKIDSTPAQPLFPALSKKNN